MLVTLSPYLSFNSMLRVGLGSGLDGGSDRIHGSG